MSTVSVDDIKRIEDRQVRIEAKIDRIMAVFGLSDGRKKRLTCSEMDNIINESVLRFRKKSQNRD